LGARLRLAAPAFTTSTFVGVRGDVRTVNERTHAVEPFLDSVAVDVVVGECMPVTDDASPAASDRKVACRSSDR
jgi:hypothetical protein